LREALCAPNECGDDSPDQAAKCLASNHAIYHNLEDGTKKINAKTPRSLIKDKSEYKIKVNSK
jgi:hypothetical protein